MTAPRLPLAAFALALAAVLVPATALAAATAAVAGNSSTAPAVRRDGVREPARRPRRRLGLRRWNQGEPDVRGGGPRRHRSRGGGGGHVRPDEDELPAAARAVLDEHRPDPGERPVLRPRRFVPE